MAKGDIETYHTKADGKWHNKVEGDLGSEPTAHLTKEEAVREGRDMAMAAKVEHIIRNMDGTVAEWNSYGHDPRDIPG